MSKPVPSWLHPEAVNARERQRKAAQERRVALAPKVRKLIEAGATLRGTAAALGVSVGWVSLICYEHRISFAASRGKFIAEQPWQVADVSELTDEDREVARRFGIELGRAAWLKSCPKLTAKPLRHG